MQRLWRSTVILLAGLLLAALAGPVAAGAAVVDARLQAAMHTASTANPLPVIIRLADQVDPAAYRHLPKHERRHQLVQALKANSVRSQKRLRSLLQQAGIKRIGNLWHLNALAAELDPTLIASIAALPEVASIHLDGVVSLPPAQPAAVATPEWNLAATGVLDLWTQMLPAAPGTGMVVATIDTGVDASHPNLPNWRGNLTDWFDPTGATTSPTDSDGHGTASMGLIAGNSVGGEAIGVAPDALWIAANPFAGTATYARLHSSFAWVLDPDGDPLTDDAPDVVNNSWALLNPGNCESEFQADINLLKAAGIGVVFAAGNEGIAGADTSQSPSNNPNVVAVGATDPDGAVAYFSSQGPSACDASIFPELVAPGVDVRSAAAGGGYVTATGTSFSAPHVAGIMALLMQSFPAATVNEIEAAMTESAVDLGAQGPDNAYGYGLVNALNAYRYLNGEAILSVYDPVAPENDLLLDFGNVTPTAVALQSLTLRNAGSADLVLGTLDFAGLPPEITVDADPCSGTTLPSGGECVIPLRFSPPDFLTYSGSLTIPSDDPVNPSVVVSVSGTGNTPPPAPVLVAPQVGASNVARPVTFSWRQAADADADSVSTALLISLSPDFSQSTPIVVTSTENTSSAALLAGCGLLAVGLLLRRHARTARLFLASLAALLLLSCGGGGGGSIVGDLITYQHTNLNANTTYFWKVQATDSRGAVSESSLSHFTTAP